MQWVSSKYSLLVELLQESASSGPAELIAARGGQIKPSVPVSAAVLPDTQPQTEAAAHGLLSSTADEHLESPDSQASGKAAANAGDWMSPERAVKSLLVPSWVPSKLPIRGIPPGGDAEVCMPPSS